MMRSLFGGKNEHEAAPQTTSQQPAAPGVRPPLRPPLTPRPAAVLNGDDAHPAQTPQETRNNARMSGAERNATAPAPAEMEDVESIFDLPFTDIFMPIHWPVDQEVEPARWAPEVIGQGQAKTWPFPDSLKKSLEELRQEIFRQKEAKTGEFVHPDGTRYPRWWNGAVTFDGMRLRYAISITAFGETWAVVRRVPLEIPRIESLGIPLEAATTLKRLGLQTSGLILVAGATSAGKTTTAVAMFGEFMRKYGKVGYSIEDPAEYRLAGVHGDGLCIQTEAEYNGGFSHAIKTALRSFPNYILIGEIRDTTVALAALQASMSGHLVISTLHAGNVSDALDSFVRLIHGSASESVREQFAQQLVAIVHQTRFNGAVGLSIMEITSDIRRDLRRLMGENKTGALGDDSWVKQYPARQS